MRATGVAVGVPIGQTSGRIRSGGEELAHLRTGSPVPWWTQGFLSCTGAIAGAARRGECMTDGRRRTTGGVPQPTELASVHTRLSTDSRATASPKRPTEPIREGAPTLPSPPGGDVLVGPWWARGCPGKDGDRWSVFCTRRSWLSSRETGRETGCLWGAADARGVVVDTLFLFPLARRGTRTEVDLFCHRWLLLLGREAVQAGLWQRWRKPRGWPVYALWLRGGFTPGSSISVLSTPRSGLATDACGFNCIRLQADLREAVGSSSLVLDSSYAGTLVALSFDEAHLARYVLGTLRRFGIPRSVQLVDTSLWLDVSV